MQINREELKARADAELLSELAKATADDGSRDRLSSELWGRWWPALNGYLARRFSGAGRQAREDAAAITLNSLILDPSAYDPARGELGSYLRTIAYRELVDLLKEGQNRVPIHSVIIPVPVEPEPAAGFVQKPGFADVIALNVLDEMTEADRDTVRLWSRGYRHAEIGEYIGATEEAVRVRLHRIRKRIKAAAKGWI